MKTVRIGNDIVVHWQIFKNGQPAELSYEKNIAVYLSCKGDVLRVDDYIVDGNTIIFKFPGRKQHKTGSYRLTYCENEALEGMYTTDACDAFILVETCDKVTKDDMPGNVQIETITLSSELTVPADGLSAYEIWLRTMKPMPGHDTEEDFCKWLKSGLVSYEDSQELGEEERSTARNNIEAERKQLVVTTDEEERLSNITFSDLKAAIECGRVPLLKSHGYGVFRYLNYDDDNVCFSRCCRQMVENIDVKSNGETIYGCTELEPVLGWLKNLPLRSGKGKHSVLQTGSDAENVSGGHSASFGQGNIVQGDYAFAEGQNNVASNLCAHAEGTETSASGLSSHAEGNNTEATGNYSHAEGYKTQAIGSQSHAEGYQTKANAEYGSHAEGNSTEASGNYSHAEGYKTTTLGRFSHAEGNSTNANGEDSHVEGVGTITLNRGEHAEGYYNVSHIGTSSVDKTIHSIGVGTSPTNRQNAIEVQGGGNVYVLGIGGYDGKNSQTEGIKSLQKVVANTVDLDTEQNILVAKTFSAGINMNGTRIRKLATPLNSDDAANKSYVDGAVSKIPVEVGEGTMAIKTRGVSHDASGNGAVAVGIHKNIASGENSHAEGKETKAYSKGSHAEGYQTIAGDLNDPTTDHNYSHSEGHTTQAIGKYSHSEGYGSIANGNASHAEGYSTVTNNRAEMAIGHFNKSNKQSDTYGNTGNTTFSIGIGTSDTVRKNAVEVMQNGDVYVKGVGNYQGDNPASAVSLAKFLNENLASKKYVDGELLTMRDEFDYQSSKIDNIAQLAIGAQQAIVFDSYLDLVTRLNSYPIINRTEDYEEKYPITIGQNIYIKELNVPDLWVSKIRAYNDCFDNGEFFQYGFTTNNEFINYIKAGGWIGAYQFSLLETAKVNLSDTATKTEVKALKDRVAELENFISQITTKEE